MKHVCVEAGIDGQPSAAGRLSRISHAKNRMEAARGHSGAWTSRDEQVSKSVRVVHRALKEATRSTSMTCSSRRSSFSRQSTSVRERYSKKFRYVMVDDYQDTNRPQYLLVRHLAGSPQPVRRRRPDQSIYKWRGADLRNILDFEHDFPEVATVRLERNYRSTQVILDAASAVISNNRNRKEKRLYTDRQGGAKILYYRAGDDLDEAEFVARTSRRPYTRIPRTPSPSVSDQRAVAHAGGCASAAGTPYRIIGGVRFYERKGGQGRARLSQADPEPARRCEFSTRRERSGTGHRQGGHGGARGASAARGSADTHRRCWPSWTPGLE